MYDACIHRLVARHYACDVRQYFLCQRWQSFNDSDACTTPRILTSTAKRSIISEAHTWGIISIFRWLKIERYLKRYFNIKKYWYLYIIEIIFFFMSNLSLLILFVRDIDIKIDIIDNSMIKAIKKILVSLNSFLHL